MALVIKDRVKETTTTTGTGTYTLAGAVTGFETFTANLSNSDTTYYVCTDNTDFEVGLGTFTSSGTTLARTTVLASSNSNNAVNWSSGTRSIFMTYPADKAVFEDASNNINGTFVGNITGNVTGNVSGTAATVTGAAQTNITSIGTLASNLNLGGQDIVTTTSNQDIDLAAHGTGKVVVKGNTNQGAIKLNCEANSHGQTIIAAPHSESANNTLTLPSTGGDARLVSTSSTATLTNKTLTTPTINGATLGSANLATSSNGDINFAPNGTGKIVVRGNTNQGKIVLNCESNSHGQTIIAAPHSESANNVLTLPSTGGDARLVSATSTATLTNKTLTSPKINEDVAVTSTATELNLLDGVTATTAELNILDGVTSTAAELNILDGVTSTTAELNILDGVTASAADINLIDGITNGTVIASKAIITDSNKDITGGRNITISGELDAATLDISGDADIDGTLEADAITVNGTALSEVISDTTGAMFSSNTETGVTVTYQDADNTIDVAIDAAQTAITSVVNTSLEIGRDADNRIKFGTDNQIIFEVSGGDNVIFKASGEIEASSLDISGDADIDGTLEADAITVGGTALNTVIAGVTVTNATTAAVATTVTISDNENTNEDNALIFTAGGDVDGGNIGLESDGDLTYNPSTGRLTATQLAGTLQTAAQANVTSLGTLTTLTVDNVIINGSTIGHTGDTDLMTVASGVLTVAGEVDATSLDISGDADIDGTLEADAITVNGTALNTVIADEATALAIALG